MALEVYGGWHNNAEIRMQSSSGGLFSALAEKIILLKGYVYGASLQINDGKISCQHVECSTIEDLCQLRGSKYMISELSDMFLKIKNRLNNHRWVLFCGTPCQVEGLLSYLEKEYDNLVTVDFICHGVPAPYLFEKVKDELEEKYKSPICKVEFRNKESGWEDYSLRIEFQNGKVYDNIGRTTNYMKLFFSNMYLRESCYHCQFKGVNRKSDITLGDFWGINRHHFVEEKEQLQGVSVILSHSDKGHSLIESVKDRITLFESNADVFKESNIYIKISALKPVDRLVFKNGLRKWTTDDLLRKIEKGKKYRIILGKVKKKLIQTNAQKSFEGLPDSRYCYSCGACAAICPVNAINMKKKELGFIYPEIDKKKCIECNLCQKVCPQKIN